MSVISFSNYFKYSRRSKTNKMFPVSSETPSDHLSVTPRVELKRLHETPPPFSILKSTINSKLKKHQQVFRMTSAQLARTLLKRPETPFNLGDKLKIIGHAHQYNRYFETETKPLTSQIVSRKATISITRQSVRRKADYSSVPKHSMQDFNKLLVKEDVEIDQILSRNSAKLSSLFREKQMKQKNLLLVLSVEFLLVENKFWKEDEIEDEAARHWKKLQSVANIVWIAKKEKSLKKIQVFAEKAGVAVDTVYLVKKPRKKKVITLNLKLLELEMNTKNYQRVIYIEGISRHHSSERNNEHYWCKLPVTSMQNISLNLIEFQQHLKYHFNAISSILYKQSTFTLDVHRVLESYSLYLSQLSAQKSRNSVLKPKKTSSNLDQENSDDSSQVLRRTDYLKGSWIKEISTRYKLQNKEREAEKDSIPYAIGDLLKRNFTIMADLMAEEKKWEGKTGQPPTEVYHQSLQLNYPNVIYVWKF